MGVLVQTYILTDDVSFHCFYVVDPTKTKTDVELESIDVGNGPGLPRGLMKFNFESPAPSQSMIETSGGAFEVAGLYLSARYRDKEFCRIGYYVRYEYANPALQENTDANPALQENTDASPALQENKDAP